MSTLMTTPTPGMVSPPANFSLDAIRRLHRVEMPGLHKDEDDDEEEHAATAASQDTGMMNGDCEEEDVEEEGAEEGCSVGEAEGDGDGDDEAPRQPSADDGPRRNKRKNFKPRNILYDEDNPQAAAAMPAPGHRDGHGDGASDSDGDEQAHGLEHHGADLAANLDAHGVKRRSRKPLFAPQKRYAVEEGGSPVPRFGALDLSAQGVQQPEHEDDSSAFGEDDDSRSSYPTLNHLNSGPEDESSDVNLSDGGGGGGGVAPGVSMLGRNQLLKPRVHVRAHLDRDRDSSSAADGDSSLDLSSSDGRLFGRDHRQVFGAPDASPRGPGSSSPTAEDALAADLSRARDLDGMLAANPLGTMAAHMAAAAAFRRQQGGQGPEHNAMKEFAEKTMRELLGIYGIGAADIGEPLSGLPMANFASGKILEALSAGGAAGALNLGLARAAAAQQQRLSSPPSQPPTPPRTPLSPQQQPQQQQPTTPQPPKAESPAQQVRASTGTPPLAPTYPTPTPHQQQALAAALHAAGLTPAAGSSTEFEDFRGKLAENMSKLTGLSATSIMNDPRVMLPQNLHTILTLAALQDQQGVAAKAVRTPALPMLDAKSGGLLQGMPTLAAAGLGGVPVGAGAVVPGAGVAAGKAAAPIDYSRYVKRFSSALECGRAFCRDLNYREHFHCIECNSRVFVKKEEMIRHFKWHKKRAESLAHGFMRYSPNDDCADRYRDCSHNRKQTHYHCIKENCDKVYISTSDVQMHANYHRKDSAIIQEGFQRYRATEECRTEYCVFFGQRTTHFHCRREGCKYTFKNKADMEKHKTYHIKDEQLTRDGFKKFMKQDPCPFEGCRFSGNCNHIHCIRSGCSYVLHSSGQLFSHKRKHERKDSELAYRKYKLAQSMMKSLVDGQAFADQFGSVEDVGALQSLMAGLGGQPAAPQPPSQHGADLGDGASSRSLSPGQSQGGPNHAAPPPHPLLALQQHMPAFRLGLDMLPPPYMLEGAAAANSDAPTDLSRSSPTGELPPSWHTPQPAATTPQQLQQQSPQQAQNLPDEALWQRVSWRFSPCTAERCSQSQGLVDVIPGRGEHWHCRAEGCAMVLRAREGVLEHARNHDAQDQISEAHYVTVGGNASNARASPSAGEGKCHCDQDCPYQDKEKHYHCTWDNCREVILPSDKPFRRLDHYKMHEYSRKLSQSRDPLTTMHLASSIDAMFRRKRGRPPKNRVIEVWNDYNTLELLQEGFMLFEQGEGSRCGDGMCTLSGRRHFHCRQPRCFYATDREDVLLMHARDFHDNIDILPGFVFFDRSIDCRSNNCPSNRANRHFHCSRPGCGYSFVRYSNMAQHEAKHRGEHNNNNQDSDKPAADALGLGVSAAMGTPLREMSPVGSAAGTMSPLAGAGGSTGGSLPGTPSPAPGTPRSRPPSTPQQHAGDPGRTTDIVKTEPDAAAGSHSLARLLQHHAESGAGVNAMLPSPTASTPSSAASATPQHPATLPEWMSPDRHVRYGPEQSCSRPFCKLKRKEHYHCNACNQAFSELERLRPHIAKHSTGALSPGTPLKREGAATPEEAGNEDGGDQPGGAAASGLPADHPAALAMGGMPAGAAAMGGVALGLSPHAGMHGQVPGFAPHPFNAAMAAAVANQQLALMTSQGLPYLQHGMPAIYSSPSGLMFACTPSGFGAPHPLAANGLLDHRLDGVAGVAGVPGLHAQHLALKRAMSPHIMAGHQDMSPEAKKARIQNSMRILKDEPVPEGYIRFRFNEDCKYPHCGYREHQTHFHCMRQDCGYSFCDKTRFVQHTARHERLDTLMGGDFQQFRANVSCNRPDCVYTSTLGAMQNKASHFHCLKCEFVCTDTNKVVAHRRQHQKLDSIMAAGFEKFTPSQPCHSESCAHSGKQTHYHCLSCHYAVLGLSQMSAHKFRHMD